MRRRPRSWLATAVTVAILAAAGACSSGDGGVATTSAGAFVGADGIVIESADTARIVTLTGDLTEFVYALGLGESVVATDVTTVEPEEAVMLPKVGIGRFLTPEGVLKHDPTLVIGDEQTSPATSIEQIRAAGVPVAILEVATSFEELHSKVTQLGVLLSAEDAATSLNDRLHDDIAAASASDPSSEEAPRIAYVYTRGPDVMLLFGEGMTTTPVIEAAGGVDAGVEAGVEGNIPVTPEALAAAAPAVIIVPSEGYEVLGGLEGLLAIPGIAATPAGAAGAVLDYPEGDFLTFGPRIAESVALLVEDLATLPSRS